MTENVSPNAEFIRTWNDILVPKFARFRHILVDGFREHSDAALARHPVRAGERVLNVGCGFGDTTLEASRVALGPKARRSASIAATRFSNTGAATPAQPARPTWTSR